MIQHLSGGRYAVIRVLNESDRQAMRAFLVSMANDAKRQRFLGQLAAPETSLVERMMHPGGSDDVTLLALSKQDSQEIIVGVCQYRSGAKPTVGDCAIVVADDWRHKGLGTALMHQLIEVAKSAGLQQLALTDSAENLDMRVLAHELGFHVRPDPLESRQVTYDLDLSTNTDTAVQACVT
jgi:GNAT superfamily N-acetyltransferase